MEGTKISEMTEKTTVEGTEYIPIVDTDGSNKKMKSSLLKGQKGDTGAQGPQGETGAQGPAGANGADGQDGLSVTKIELQKDAEGNITGGTATLSDESTIAITITTVVS